MSTHQHLENSQKEKPLREKRNHRNATDFSEGDLRKFWSRVKKGNQNECWNWTYRLNRSGYGLFFHKGKTLRAHRMSMILIGHNVDDLCVCHHCDNPPCVNPSHLFLGTQQDNMRDREAKGRTSKDGTLKINSNDIAEIKRIRLLPGYTNASVGRMFCVSGATVSRVINKKPKNENK